MAPPAASPKSRPRKKITAAVDSEQIYHGEVVEMKPERAARRIFKGVALPEAPVFALQSASDPDDTMEFTGIAALPGMQALHLAVDGISAETLTEFFTVILGEEQYEQFKAFAEDPKRGITLGILVDLAKYLVEEYTSRPTKGSTGS